MNQIRFEELIESVQAPLWFAQGEVIAGTHTNIGWYAFLLIIYKIFGFSLNTAKLALLGISFMSILSIAILVRRLFTPLPGILILLTLSLSPTLLFFTTQNLHLGVGLQMVPIFILLMVSLNFKKIWSSFLLEVFIFALMMVCLLFYPTFMFYIPSLSLFYLFRLKKHFAWKHILVVTISFLMPLIVGFIYINNRQILLLDTQSGTGLFRGGGKISFSEETFSQAWGGLFRDLFIQAGSYHFEVYKVDFSDIYPIITVLFIFYFAWQIFVQVKQSRKYILLCLLVLGFSILVISITSDYGIPGMKRSTPILASIYFLWVLSWYYLTRSGRPEFISGSIHKIPKPVISMVILSLLTVHHLIVYPQNLVHISDPSPFAAANWFKQAGSPQQSLDNMVNLLQKKDLRLDCREVLTRFTSCDYDFIYSALILSCQRNHLNCRNILGYDGKTNQFIPLSVNLLQNKYFE